MKMGCARYCLRAPWSACRQPQPCKVACKSQPLRSHRLGTTPLGSTSPFLGGTGQSKAGLYRRRARGALAPRYKVGGEEEEERPLAGKQGQQVEEGKEERESIDQQESLETKLEASQARVSDEPAQIQTPAAVWLPYNGERRAVKQAWGLPAMISTLLSFPGRLANWALLAMQRLMTGSVAAKLASYFAIGMPLVLGCAVLYSWASGKSLAEGLVQSFGNLYKVPGTVVLGDVNLAATLLNSVVFFLGTFTFALILGVITEEVGDSYRRVREGNYPVQARGHTLILNWNAQLVPLLRQMLVAKEERGAFQGPVVVLAEREKQAMDSQLAAALGQDLGNLDVTTRAGPPTSTLYLDRAAASQAHTVLVLAPEAGAEGEGPRQDCAAERQVASLLALQALRESACGAGAGGLRPQTVVLQSPPAPTAAAAPRSGSSMPSADSMAGSMDSTGSSAGGDGGGEGAGRRRHHAHPVVEAARSLMAASAQPVEFADMDLAGTMASIMAQSAVQPGVASVWCSLVQQTLGGAELYIRRFPELGELPYGEARRRFADAVPLGYLSLGVSPDVHGFSKEKEAQEQGAELALHGERWPHVHLNPADSDLLLDNTALVLVAKTGNIQPLGWEPQEFVLARQEEEAVNQSTEPHAPASAGPNWFEDLNPHRALHDVAGNQGGRHVFVLEWGANGESPPSHRVNRVVAALKACLPQHSVITVVGAAAPLVDCSTCMDESEFWASNMPHHMHMFEEGVHDKSIMQSTDSEARSATDRQARARREPRKTVHLQHIPAAAGGGDLHHVLEDAGLAGADAALVLTSSSPTDDGGVEADAHIISALLLLQDVVAKGSREPVAPPLHVLGAVHRPETVQVANHLLGKLGKAGMTAELLQPDELAAGMLTQMAAEPLLRPVLGAFMATHRGPTIRLCPPARYALPGGHPLSFASVAERVRAGGETALGYITGSGRLILGPLAAEERSYAPEDRVVVLA